MIETLGLMFLSAGLTGITFLIILAIYNCIPYYSYVKLKKSSVFMFHNKHLIPKENSPTSILFKDTCLRVPEKAIFRIWFGTKNYLDIQIQNGFDTAFTARPDFTYQQNENSAPETRWRESTMAFYPRHGEVLPNDLVFELQPETRYKVLCNDEKEYTILPTIHELKKPIMACLID